MTRRPTARTRVSQVASRPWGLVASQTHPCIKRYQKVTFGNVEGSQILSRRQVPAYPFKSVASARTRGVGHARALKIILCGVLVMGFFQYSHIYI